MKAWRNMEHKILNINFKETHTGSGIKIMPYISLKLLKLLSSVEF